MDCTLLDDDDVKKLLPIEDCVGLLERAYADLDAKAAVCSPRSNLAAATDSDREYVLKSWQCIHPGLGVAAVRLCSEVMNLHRLPNGRLVGRPEAACPDKGYLGLVLLFDIASGRMISIAHDAALSAIVVAASVGLATRHLARSDASVLAMLGAGRQARLQIAAIAAARQLSEIRVFYPLHQQCKRFGRELAQITGLEVKPTPTVGQAIAGCDIVATASSSPVPVFASSMIQEGMHVTLTRPSEAPRNFFDIADVLVTSGGKEPVTISKTGAGGLWRQRGQFQPAARARVVTLGSVINGRRPGRTSIEQVTVYGALAGYSSSIFYATLGAELVSRARREKVGKTLAANLFLQGHPS